MLVVIRHMMCKICLFVKVCNVCIVFGVCNDSIFVAFVLFNSRTGYEIENELVKRLLLFVRRAV